jgi:hypothetical protein
MARLGGADETGGCWWRVFEEGQNAQGIPLRECQPLSLRNLRLGPRQHSAKNIARQIKPPERRGAGKCGLVLRPKPQFNAAVFRVGAGHGRDFGRLCQRIIRSEYVQSNSRRAVCLGVGWADASESELKPIAFGQNLGLWSTGTFAMPIIAFRLATLLPYSQRPRHEAV